MKIQIYSFFALLCFIFSPLFAAPEITGTPNEIREIIYPQAKVIVIRAQAVETDYSDKAIITIVVTTEEEELAASMQNNKQLREKILTRLQKAGIAAKEINTAKFSTSPQYGWFGEKPDSYKVVNRMDVGVYAENQLIELAKIADEYEEVVLADTRFEHTKKREFQNRVKQKALEDILQQKKFYEESLGIKLVAHAIRDIHVYEAATQGAKFRNARLMKSPHKDQVAPMNQDFAPPEISQSSGSQFDEIKYEANMFVEFRIEDQKLEKAF